MKSIVKSETSQFAVIFHVSISVQFVGTKSGYLMIDQNYINQHEHGNWFKQVFTKFGSGPIIAC